ncbi:probable adenylate kinase 7, mitochondrial [Lolium rigidum]|uniref:probable adenylate kinase 7, mitochondrial n=1 Tax=Lolium rigidum TaxID=89674 RepID=UPI001F5CC60F|nr:probable adenylate kinase 7, mitochondrial [Lolium rigidum]
MAGLLRLAGAARSLSRALAPAARHHRTLASSAAALAEDECWSEWEEEEEQRRQRARASAPAAESFPAGGGPTGVQWVVMGRPGPQKHAHAARLAEVLAVPYISMGTLVRQELSPTSSLYKKIANSVNEGKLVPEDIIFGLLTKRLEDGYNKGETGFILDGIPRTRMQAEILDEIVDIDLVLNFKCADNCFMKRRSGGDICTHCGQLFDASSTVSRERNLSLGSPTWHAQAQPASIVGLENPRMEKMRAYAEQAKQLEDYYKKHRKLVELKTSARPGETWQGLVSALQLQHLDPSPTPHKLTA